MIGISAAHFQMANGIIVICNTHKAAHNCRLWPAHIHREGVKGLRG